MIKFRILFSNYSVFVCLYRSSVFLCCPELCLTAGSALWVLGSCSSSNLLAEESKSDEKKVAENKTEGIRVNWT
jgi:hypothetical protein